jgi:hypothetical protein
MNLTLLFAVLTAPAGGVVVFQGAPGAPGNVAVADPAGLQASAHPAELQGIELLPIDFHGRVEIERLLPGRARLRSDVPSGRVELPQGAGSLYRFSRVEPGGGTTFGLMLVDAVGEARSVFELSGVGASGAETPFKQRIAVAPQGDTVLLATRPNAGGDLLELDLATGVVTNRTASLPPLKYGRAGLALASTWGVAVASDRVLRFDRTQGAEAETVQLGAGGQSGTKPGWFSGEVVLSPSGLFAATTAGNGPTSQHVWAFAPTGAAVRATRFAAHLSSAGFLPESSHGPYLAISDDGTRCAWRTEGFTREAFLARVPDLPSTPPPPEHVTSDQLYLDTLDEIGQFMFQVASTTLRLAVGEASLNPGGGIESIDYYEMDLPPTGAVSITNRTQTNGLVQAPFFVKSTLNPVSPAWVPGSDGYLFVDDETEQLACSFAGSPSLQTLVPEVKDLAFLELVGGEVVIGLRRSIGNKDYELWTAPVTLGSAALAVSLPGSSGLARPTVRPDGWIGVFEETPLKERLWLYDTVSGTLRNYRKLVYGPAIDFAPSGELAFSVGGLGGPAIQAVLPVAGAPARLKVPVAPSYVLPGA